MPDPQPPCFFFSYSRNDFCSYLKKFFDELSDRVARKGALDRDKGEVSFRDIDNIAPGDDWDNEISEALATCLTLVSIYTPWYFNRPYCGKEFGVFLRRQPGVCVDESDGVAQGSTKIVPVLWESAGDLEKHGLPPAIARNISYTTRTHWKTYVDKGLRLIRVTRGSGSPYAEILDELAGVIVSQAQQNPLAPLEHPPSLGDIDDVFSKSSGPPPDPPPSADSLRIVYLTAEALGPPRTATDRHRSSLPRDWRPFPSGDQIGIHVVIKETASQLGFDTYFESGFDATEWDGLNDLEKASDRNEVCLVIVDPRFACDDRGRSVVTRILESRSWRGGILVPIDEEDAESPVVKSQLADLWALAGGSDGRLVLKAEPGSLSGFRRDLVEVLTELQRRIAAEGPISAPLTGPGPATVYHLRGPGEVKHL